MGERGADPQRLHKVLKVKVLVLSHVDSLRSHGLQPARLLCPWDSSGENTGVGCHSFCFWIFLTQGAAQLQKSL